MAEKYGVDEVFIFPRPVHAVDISPKTKLMLFRCVSPRQSAIPEVSATLKEHHDTLVDNLEEIKFENLDLDVDMLCRFLEKATKLHSITIVGCSITIENLQRIADSIVKNQSLMSSLDFLDLSDNSLDDTAIGCLLPMLRKSNLESLNLGYNEISFYGALQLSQVFFSERTSPKALILNGNEIGTEGAKLLQERCGIKLVERSLKANDEVKELYSILKFFNSEENFEGCKEIIGKIASMASRLDFKVGEHIEVEDELFQSIMVSTYRGFDRELSLFVDALARMDKEFAQKLLNKKDSYDVCPLNHAELDNNMQIVELLLEKNASPVPDIARVKESPLISSWIHKNIEVFDLLLKSFLSTTKEDMQTVVKTLLRSLESPKIDNFYAHIQELNNDGIDQGIFDNFCSELDRQYIGYCQSLSFEGAH